MGKIIIYILSIAISMIVNIYCYKLLTREKININFKNILLLIILSSILFIANTSSNSVIKLILNLTAKIILLKAFYSLKIDKAVYYATVFWILIIIIELFSTIFISSLKITTPQEFTKSYFYIKIILSIIMPSLQYLFLAIPIIRRFINYGYDKTKVITNNTQLLLAIILSMTFLSILNTLNMDKMGSHYIIICIVVIVCILLVWIIFLTNRQMKLKDINKKIMEKNCTYIDIADNYATLRHNIINQFLTIKSITNKKTQTMIDEIIKEYESQYKIITNVHKIPKGLQGIIYQKILQTDEDIKVNVVNSLKNDPFLKLKPKKYNELCETMGILVDNAVEGALSSHDKVIYIEFSQIKNTNDINIVIINTFNGEIDLDRFGDKHYTTKNEGHGIGVNYVLKKNVFKISNKIINNLFRVEVKIKDAI